MFLLKQILILITNLGGGATDKAEHAKLSLRAAAVCLAAGLRQPPSEGGAGGAGGAGARLANRLVLPVTTIFKRVADKAEQGMAACSAAAPQARAGVGAGATVALPPFSY